MEVVSGVTSGGVVGIGVYDTDGDEEEDDGVTAAEEET